MSDSDDGTGQVEPLQYRIAERGATGRQTQLNTNRFTSAMGVVDQVAVIIQDHVARFKASLALSDQDIVSLTAGIVDRVLEDFESLLARDPAAKERVDESLHNALTDNETVVTLLHDTYPSMQAVLWYRVANAVYYCDFIEDEHARREIALTRIYPAGRVKTGIDIDPRAKIGCRFVIDHGAGTVIGRHVVIGDDCYVLHGVTLGAGPPKAPGTAVDGSVSRHPSVGNRVTIYAYAKVLGAITVGDDVTIGTGCLITESIPSGSRVRVVNQYQIARSPASVSIAARICIFGIVPVGDGFANIQAKGIEEPKFISIVNEDDESEVGFNVCNKGVDSSSVVQVLRIAFTAVPDPALSDGHVFRELIRFRIKLTFVDESVLYLCQFEGIRQAMSQAVELGRMNHGK